MACGIYPQLNTSIDDYNRNDSSNAKLFASQFRDVARYCGEAKAWYVFNGKFWEQDLSGKVTWKLQLYEGGRGEEC